MKNYQIIVQILIVDYVWLIKILALFVDIISLLNLILMGKLEKIVWKARKKNQIMK